MADYREISQQYAQGAIKAAAVLNGGAAVAILTQAASLLEMGYGGKVSCSLMLWTAGVFFSALCWISAFASTRFVDRSTEGFRDEQTELRRSDRFMAWGIGLCLLSLILFLAGAAVLAWQLKQDAPQEQAPQAGSHAAVPAATTQEGAGN